MQQHHFHDRRPHPFPEPVRRALADECSHLFVDEAHHITAPQWDWLRGDFDVRQVVQFTATPFRADGKHLAGRIVSAFPLREAQRLGYFSRVDYLPITDLRTRTVSSPRPRLPGGRPALPFACRLVGVGRAGSDLA
jgi:superfamily II DNA or RNA helicase